MIVRKLYDSIRIVIVIPMFSVNSVPTRLEYIGFHSSEVFIKFSRSSGCSSNHSPVLPHSLSLFPFSKISQFRGKRWEFYIVVNWYNNSPRSCPGRPPPKEAPCPGAFRGIAVSSLRSFHLNNILGVILYPWQ